MEELAALLGRLAAMENNLEQLDAVDPGFKKTMDAEKNTVDWDAKLAEMDRVIGGLEKMRDAIENSEPEDVDWSAAFSRLAQSVVDLKQENAAYTEAVDKSSR